MKSKPSKADKKAAKKAAKLSSRDRTASDLGRETIAKIFAHQGGPGESSSRAGAAADQDPTNPNSGMVRHNPLVPAEESEDMYAAPQLAKNVLGVTEVAGFAYGSPVAATPDDGSFDDDDYVDPDARREAASAPVAMATPGYGKPVHPAAPLLIDEAEELYDIPSITSTSAAAGSDLPAEDAEAMYENADAEGMSAAQRLAAGSDLPAEDAEAMYGNTDAAGKSLLAPRGRTGTLDVSTALEDPVLIPEPTLSDLDLDGRSSMVPEIGHPDGEEDKDTAFGWGGGDSSAAAEVPAGFGTSADSSADFEVPAGFGASADSSADAEVPAGFGASADGDDRAEATAKKPWKPRPPAAEPETAIAFVPAVDYAKATKWTPKTGAPAPQQSEQTRLAPALDYNKSAKWAPKPKANTPPAPPKESQPAWKAIATQPVYALNTRTDDAINGNARANEPAGRRPSKFGGADTNTNLQQVGGLDESVVNAFVGTADEAVELGAAPRIVAREWAPEVQLDAAAKPVLTVGKLDVNGIAEQVAKPKERATVVASPLDLMPADAPKLQNRLKALADEAERLAAGKKQKMNAETAAEEGGFGFGFGFDVHASGMNGSGSWIGSGAPAAAVAPHNSRAIRRRREED